LDVNHANAQEFENKFFLMRGFFPVFFMNLDKEQRKRFIKVALGK